MAAPSNLPLDVRLAAQDLALSSLAARVTEQRTALDAVQATAQQAATDVVRQTLAPKWYERLGLRGYTQFRGTEVFTDGGIPLEVPTDRSVNKSESLMIRRGRFIYSGDATDHLALYAQADFNASTGATDFSLQMRDLYADVALDTAKTFRFRLGQSKVPFGFVNLQSSQNRAAIERPDALNSAVEGERDLGAYMMWAPAKTRQLFRDLINRGLKGSGDYGLIAVGAFSGQGLNRSDQNGSLHWLARASYPFALGKRQIAEFGIQAYTGDYVVTTQAIDVNGASVTPSRPAAGQTDQRVAFTAVLYPQPFGFEAEWNIGTSPEISTDFRSITTGSLTGGYVQVHYRRTGKYGAWLPFTRWQVLRWRPQVCPQRASHARQRDRLRAGSCAVGGGRSDGNVHAHARASADQRISVRVSSGPQSRGPAGAVELLTGAEKFRTRQPIPVRVVGKDEPRPFDAVDDRASDGVAQGRASPAASEPTGLLAQIRC